MIAWHSVVQMSLYALTHFPTVGISNVLPCLGSDVFLYTVESVGRQRAWKWNYLVKGCSQFWQVTPSSFVKVPVWSSLFPILNMAPAVCEMDNIVAVLILVINETKHANIFCFLPCVLIIWTIMEFLWKLKEGYFQWWLSHSMCSRKWTVVVCMITKRTFVSEGHLSVK